MSVLAFKAIGYGAEQIPDKFFEKIPGGFFTPQEKKNIDKGRKDRKDKERHKSEERSGKRSSRRDRSHPTEYSDHSAYDDTDYEREREQRKRERRRAKSAGRDPRSMSRGRHNRGSRDLDGEYSDLRDMAQAEQGEPHFPPPPTSEYKPYNPQEYASRPAQDEYRPSSANPAYGYPPQSAATQASPSQQSFGQHDRHQSASAARYTPGPGYAPSPPVNPVFPSPVGSNLPYAPYNPADYNTSGNAYASPPPFNRQRSNSQPSFVPGTNPPYPTYVPPSAEQQVTAYNHSPSRRSSTKPRREHRHRARSADSHSHSHSSKDHYRDSSRKANGLRERFDSIDLREKGLAATVGGALAGGLAGRQLGKSRLTALAGVAAGALGGRAIATRSKSRGERRSSSRDRSRSRSRTRTHDRARSKDTGIRARSRSIIDRFRSKSRGPEDRESRPDRHDRRPDHGYDHGRQNYDDFSSESESDGPPVKSRRHRRRDY